LYSALIGQWRYTLMTDRLSAAMEVAERIYSLGREQDNPILIILPYNALSCTLFFLGDFEFARQYATHALQIWRSGSGELYPEDVDPAAVGCLCYKAHSEWHLGEIASCQANLDRAISLAKELKDMHVLALALSWAAGRASEALEAINEAEAVAERFEQRVFLGRLHRFRGVLLAAIGDEETQIEASFCEAIRIAKEQNSVSLQKRAEETYAEYRRQKASGLGGRGIRLPLL
jgi:tetratricopeptide (TPR) repeat protein